MVCDYGCGQEAIHQFKNGKWCCSKSTNSCPAVRERKSEHLKGRFIGELHPMYGKPAWNKGIPRREKTKRKISKSNTGKILSKEHKKAIGKANTNPSKKTRKLMSKSQKGKIISKKQRRQISIANKYSIEMINKKYPTFSKIEEMRYNPDKPGEKEIQVHCKNHNCKNSKEKGGWFTSTKYQFYGRIYSLEKEKYIIKNIESLFYCSKYCKDTCEYFLLKLKNMGLKRGNTIIGENNPNWKGGISCEPYCEQWSDKDYKESIKERDGYICLNPCCNKKYKLLNIHHIDYNKKNCHPMNLITLCVSCNSKANTDRLWHKLWYQIIIYNRYQKRYK